ncbi:MAG: nucleotide-binding domain containing protein, partial [Lacipirellulaceae bacterium]
LNPMRDANLLRVLAKQSTEKIGLLACKSYAGSIAAIRDELRRLAAEGQRFVVTDACDDSHLAQLAKAVVEMPLVTGGSGLARFLPEAYRDAGFMRAESFQPEMPQVSGRRAILAGSCSPATQGQVKHMQGRCPIWHVDVPGLMADAEAELERFRKWAASTGENETLLVASTSPPEAITKLQELYGADSTAKSIERFLAASAKLLVEKFGVRRLVLAGGETSGAIVAALEIPALRIGPEICTGVPWTETLGTEPRLALALKSGNFGDEQFFETALEMLP